MVVVPVHITIIAANDIVQIDDHIVLFTSLLVVVSLIVLANWKSKLLWLNSNYSRGRTCHWRSRGGWRWPATLAGDGTERCAWWGSLAGGWRRHRIASREAGDVGTSAMTSHRRCSQHSPWTDTTTPGSRRTTTFQKNSENKGREKIHKKIIK